MRARTCALAVLMTLGLAGPAFAQERGDYSLEGDTVTEGKTLRFVLTSEEEVKEDTDVVAYVTTLSAGEEDVRTTERSLIFRAGTRELAIPVGTVDDAKVEEPEKIVLQVVVANFCCYQITGIITDSDSSSIAWWTGTLPGGFVTTNSTFGPPMIAKPESSAAAVRIPGGSFGGDMLVNTLQWVDGRRLRFIVKASQGTVFGQYDATTGVAGFAPNAPTSDFRTFLHGMSWNRTGTAYLLSGGFARYLDPSGRLVECCPNPLVAGDVPPRLQGAQGSDWRPGFNHYIVSAFDSNTDNLRQLFAVAIPDQKAYAMTPPQTDQYRDPAYSPDGRYVATIGEQGLNVLRVLNPSGARTELGSPDLVARAGGVGDQPGLNFMRTPTWWPGSTDALAKIAFTAELSRGAPGTGSENGPRDIYVATLRNLSASNGISVVSVEKFPQSTEFDDLEPAWGPAVGGELGKSLSSAGGGAYASKSPVRIAPAGGVVRYTPAGSDQGELLASAQAVAASTLVDTRKGRARLTRTKVPVAGAVFEGGLARVEFTGKGGRGVGLGLAGGTYARCLGKRLGEVRRLDVAVSRGSIRVRGREATAIAPKGARLRVSDRCDGTRVSVSRGKVRVGRKQVRAGKAVLVK